MNATILLTAAVILTTAPVLNRRPVEKPVAPATNEFTFKKDSTPLPTDKVEEIKAEKVETPPSKTGTKHPPLYTTYFYTAAEAVVHGYEPDTTVRVISLQKGGTIWQGKVGPGEMQTVKTGAGVFGFLSDKKASILVGTPSSCAVVGYFLKDQNGNYRSNKFYTQLPSRTHFSDERMIVWAYEPTYAEIYDRKAEKVIKSGELKAGGFLEISGAELVGNRVLEVRSKGAPVAVQVYYDEGFIAPGSTGRGAAKDFYVYVGNITTGQNDLNVISQAQDANVTITDIKGDKVLFKGKVPRGGIHTLTLAQKYVRVQSDVSVNVVVAAFKHYQAGYAEHHFGTGIEGGGIDNDFMVTTSGELWLFSYFDGNPVVVTNAQTGAKIFEGKLNAGGVRGVHPGFGLFRVKSQMGMSVMGGASSCGADYSPAAGMFAVDEAVFDVVAQVQSERLKEAQKRGETLAPEALAAPISGAEWSRHQKKMKDRGLDNVSLEEANQRAATMQQQQ